MTKPIHPPVVYVEWSDAAIIGGAWQSTDEVVADAKEFYRWRAERYTDRLDKATSFAYDDPDGTAGSRITTVATDANGHATTFGMDGFGRPDRLVNAKNETTELVWDADDAILTRTATTALGFATKMERFTQADAHTRQARPDGRHVVGQRCIETSSSGHRLVITRPSPCSRRSASGGCTRRHG